MCLCFCARISGINAACLVMHRAVRFVRMVKGKMMSCFFTCKISVGRGFLCGMKSCPHSVVLCPYGVVVCPSGVVDCSSGVV